MSVSLDTITERVQNMGKDIGDIKESLKSIEGKIDNLDSRFADKEQFIFWRNILVSGIILSIFLGVINTFIK